MCGIHVAVSSDSPHILSHDSSSRLQNRGPDHLGKAEVKSGSRFLTFTSTVLALRGDHVTKQPFVDSQTRSVLCWNGEAWKIAGHRVDGNDGEAIFRLLTEASASSSGPGNEDAILDILRSIEGPFAFVYFNQPTRNLYFGRDRLGRRSLEVYHDQSTGTLVLSSIAELCNPSWKEVEADGIYSHHLGDPSEGLCPISRHDWLANQCDLVSGLGVFNTSLPLDAVVLNASSLSVTDLKEQLTESLRLRVLDIPKPPCLTDLAEEDTRVAVLYSGGLDCSVIARLTHELLGLEQGIDLLNVAFENPRVVAQLKKEAKGASVDPYEACPDRITGRKSFAELQRSCPGRRFHFVAVNIPYSETQAHRSEVVSLIHPHDTEMDLSIAYALYFAARGQGLCSRGDSPACQYTSPARVLLSGLGADELFGGYVRHATAFARQGYPGLVDELKLDVSRLGKRNLGRDDRAMAHWGKEVRFPFLDERLVRWAIETPACGKCDFANAEQISGIEPGKRVLRLLALGLGIEGVAKEKKRAEDTIWLEDGKDGKRSCQRDNEDILKAHLLAQVCL